MKFVRVTTKFFVPLQEYLKSDRSHQLNKIRLICHFSGIKKSLALQ